MDKEQKREILQALRKRQLDLGKPHSRHHKDQIPAIKMQILSNQGYDDSHVCATCKHLKGKITGTTPVGIPRVDLWCERGKNQLKYI